MVVCVGYVEVRTKHFLGNTPTYHFWKSLTHTLYVLPELCIVEECCDLLGGREGGREEGRGREGGGERERERGRKGGREGGREDKLTLENNTSG